MNKKYFSSIALATQLFGAFSINNNSLAAPSVMRQGMAGKVFSFLWKKKDTLVSLIAANLVAILNYFLNEPKLLCFGESKTWIFDYTGKERLELKKIRSGDILRVNFKDLFGKNKEICFDIRMKNFISLAQELRPFFLLCCSEKDQESLMSLKKVEETVVNFKCYDICSFLSEKIAELKEIKDVETFYRYVQLINEISGRLLPRAKKGSGDTDRYSSHRDVIFFVLGSGLIDMSYTRTGFEKVESTFKGISSKLKEIADESVKNEVLKVLKASEFYKEIIGETLCRVGESLWDKKSGSKKFNVNESPNCLDLVKYILIARHFYGKVDKDVYCTLLDKIIMYIVSDPSHVKKELTDSKDKSNRNFEKWNKKQLTEFFDCWLDLKNEKNLKDVTFKLVKLLRKYLKEEEVKVVEEKFLRDVDVQGKIVDKLDNQRFKELFEEKNKLPEEGTLSSSS